MVPAAGLARLSRTAQGLFSPACINKLSAARREKEGCTMFQKGDYVVYGNLGVCRVEGLEERRFEGLET